MLIASSLDNELLNFIQTKKLDSLDVPLQDVYTLYSKMIIDILYCVNNSFDTIEYSIACCELAHSIFIIILNYTYNSKLTMFFCDRAKNLFIDYINISCEMRKSFKNINLVDIKMYIYSKTIGPLQLSTVSQSMNIQADSIVSSKLYSQNISKMNDLLILYKKFIYMSYKYLINHIEDKNSNLAEDMEDIHAETPEDIHTDQSINMASHDIDSKYKNDSICTSLELIRTSLDLKLFMAFNVLNELYLDELLNINIEAYDNIYVPINKILIQLQLIIDSKQKYKIRSNIVYNHIQKVSDTDCEHYNQEFLKTKYIKHIQTYKYIINLLNPERL